MGKSSFLLRWQPLQRSDVGDPQEELRASSGSLFSCPVGAWPSVLLVLTEYQSYIPRDHNLLCDSTRLRGEKPLECVGVLLFPELVEVLKLNAIVPTPRGNSSLKVQAI